MDRDLAIDMLRWAHEHGYYKSPSGTNVREVGARFGVSKSHVARTLKIAEKEAVERFLASQASAEARESVSASVGIAEADVELLRRWLSKKERPSKTMLRGAVQRLLNAYGEACNRIASNLPLPVCGECNGKVLHQGWCKKAGR